LPQETFAPATRADKPALVNSSLSLDIPSRRVQHGAQFIRDAQIGSTAVDFRATLQLRAKPFLQLIQNLPQSSRGAGELFHRLIPEERKENFVRDFGIVQFATRGPAPPASPPAFLRVSVDAHGSK